MTPQDTIVDESHLARPLRFFTVRAIDVGTVIGGPLAASYLMASNFRAMNQSSNAWRSLVAGGLFTIVLLPLLIFLPESGFARILARIVPLMIILAVHGIAKHFQAKAIGAHLANGGQKGKGRSVVGVGLLGLLVTLIYGFILFFVMAASFEPIQVPKENASLILQQSGCTVYYDSTSVNPEEARSIGGLLENLGYCDSRTKAPAIFKKRGATFSIELGISSEYWDKADIVSAARELVISLERSHPERRYQVVFLAHDETGKWYEKTINRDTQ